MTGEIPQRKCLKCDRGAVATLYAIDGKSEGPRCHTHLLEDLQRRLFFAPGARRGIHDE